MPWEVEQPTSKWIVEQESAPLPKKQKSATDMAIDVGKGAASGAADIGNTLINAATFIPRKLIPQLDQWNNERQAGLDSFNQENSSLPFTIGRIGANIAGTAGVGNVLGAGLEAVPALAKYAPVVSSGGFNLGPSATNSALTNTAIRAAGGAVLGGAQTALVDPESAGTGAAIGAVTPMAVKAAGEIGKGIKNAATGTVKHFLGASTGTGADAVSGAYQAGKQGSADFLDNMRGNVSFDDVVGKAKEGLANMRQARSDAYNSGMIDIKNDKSILDFAPIDETLKKVQNIGVFKGKVTSEEAANVVDQLTEKINQWKSGNPADFHTPEGMDALKQAIGDIRMSTKPGTSARRAADQVYNSVKNQITMQAPTYSKVMKGYSQASDLIGEIESSLSLGERAKADTSIRKLQSLMRNNVSTNYGNRQTLAKALAEQGGVDIMPAVAGQSMSSWTPRGMIGALEKAGAVGLGGLSFINAPAALAGLAMAPLTSPRIVGETAYKIGRGVGNTSAGARYLAEIALPGGATGLLDPAVFARTLPVAISASQAAQR